MNKDLILIFSSSILIAAVIGWVRFKNIHPTYYPFLFFIWIGLANEIFGHTLIRVFNSQTGINNNIYVLLESIIIPLQFKQWGLFNRLNALFFALITVLLSLWTVECFWLTGINHTFPYFRIFYSFIIVLMSVTMINNLLVRERKSILKNSIFLICLAFLIYFTYRVIVWSFWFYGLNLSNEFLLNVVSILFCINLFCNLIYALAVLWMPTRHRFSLPS